MCGIVGYVGPEQALPIVLEGLRRLEYRGYDSAGVAVTDGSLSVVKRAGKLAELESALAASGALPGRTAIGHTRWATHGAPNDLNAHPHERIVWLVHYAQLKLADFVDLLADRTPAPASGSALAAAAALAAALTEMTARFSDDEEATA